MKAAYRKSSELESTNTETVNPEWKAKADTLNVTATPKVQKIWTQVISALLEDYGTQSYDSWFRHLHPIAIDSSDAELAVPSAFMRDWICNHYGERIKNHLVEHVPGLRSIRFLVRPEVVKQATRHADVTIVAPQSSVAPPPSGNDRVFHDDVQPKDIRLDQRYTFDQFVVGKSNEFAYQAARRIANGEKVSFNPLFLHGGVGLGKTHLMHAIAWEVRARNPGVRLLYLTAERFMVTFLSALRQKDTFSFKQYFRSADILFIDDVQFIAGKESTQEEFFHTMNALIEEGRQLVISADRSPSDLEGLKERVRSRLQCGLVADINATDYELRLNILHSKIRRIPDCVIPEEVLEFLARRITSNVRELEGGINRVMAHASLTGEEVTLGFVRAVLQDLLRANDRKITIDDIQRKVAGYYNIRLADLLSSRRTRVIARPRQIAMYLAKKYTSRSLPEIGRKFGGRDHTTVIHAVNRVESLRASDQEIESDVERIIQLLDQ